MTHERDAIHARYGRNRNFQLLSEFLELRKEIEERAEDARSAFLRNQTSDALDEEKNMWEELRHLGLILKFKEALHGFNPNELNSHFAGVLVSPLEDTADVDSILEGSGYEGFKFKPITINDVILAISHFSSQARGEDEIPQSVILKALPFIGNFIVKIINAFLEQGVFPSAWKPFAICR